MCVRTRTRVGLQTCSMRACVLAFLCASVPVRMEVHARAGGVPTRPHDGVVCMAEARGKCEMCRQSNKVPVVYPIRHPQLTKNN